MSPAWLTIVFILFLRFQAFPQLTTAKYSVYPPHFAEPVYKKQELDKLYESGEIENYKLIPFKAARSNETCSIFHDPMVTWVLIDYCNI